MTRPPRIEFEGALHHVTTRGNNRKDIFFDDRDRLVFLSILSAVIARTRWVCHAYCLMDNHYHLVVETPQPNLAAGMHLLNLGYARAFNRRHGRCGHLFDRRYNPVLVEEQEHLLEVSRYVVLNPVRAGLCADAGAWRWSSYAATAGTRPCPRFLTIEMVRGSFGRGARRCSLYREFVAEGAASPTTLEAIVAGVAS